MINEEKQEQNQAQEQMQKQEKGQEQKQEPEHVKCILDGVFIQEESQLIYKEYKSFIQLLYNMKFNNFKCYLEVKDIKTIFEGLDNVDVKYCKIIEQIEYYEIVLNYDFRKINECRIFNLKKTEYKFTYNKKEYYCFLLDSMKEYLENLLKDTDFYFEVSYHPYGRNKIQDIRQFMMTNYTDFKIMISYQFEDVDYKTLDYNSMYNDKSIITGKELNLKLGHYVYLTEDQHKEFRYYDTKERVNFYNKLNSIIKIRNVIGICGPYGSGKTLTLLRMIIRQSENKCFYVNLATVHRLPLGELKKLLKYELIKLFNKQLIFPDEYPVDENLKEACNKSIQLINDLKDKNIFEVLKGIVSYIKNLRNINAYFIIDQYSSKYDIDKNQIKDFLNSSQNKNIYFIVCSSMNNSDVKSDLCECFNEQMIFPIFKIEKSFIFYIYVGSLIRLNELENYEELTRNESDDFITYLNLFGNLPLYYYYLKNSEMRRTFFISCVEEEKEKIKEEINNFYKGNDKKVSSNDIIIDIIDIMLYVNKKQIFFWEELGSTVSKLPLKFLEIKKETISIDDLKLYGLIVGDKKIDKYIQQLEKKNDLQQLVDSENISKNYTKLINEEKYCFNYISKVTEKEKIKLNYYKTNFKKDITIFYLDYLFPLMSEIFSELNYEILVKQAQFMHEVLPGQIQGGIIEFIICQHIEQNKKFLFYSVSQIETIDNFVPNEFFIQNFTTRKDDTIRAFIENKNFAHSKKKKLPKSVIFIKQLQFTGKYYDCAILFPSKNSSGFTLLLLQISKKKNNVSKIF